MSGPFTEYCLDGFDKLEKKTDTSIDGVKNLSSFFEKFGEILHKFSSDTQALCSKFKGKKMVGIDGSLGVSVLAFITDVEQNIVEPHETLSKGVEAIAKSMTSFVKENESSRKKLISESEKLQKNYDSALATLRKAKEAYHKAAKEVAAAQANPKAAGKVAGLTEKAKAADQKYGNVLVQTNERRKVYYESEQPNILSQFQQWEEGRISFVKSQVAEVAQEITKAGLSERWAAIAESSTTNSSAIDVSADLLSYAQSISNGAPPAATIEYEPAPEGPSIGAPASLASVSGGSGGDGGSVSSSYSQPVHSGGFGSSRPAPEPASYGGNDNGADDDGGDAGGEAAGDGQPFRALYDYQPENDGEMEMHEGETVYISEKDESGWWYAVARGGREGYVPSAYVEPI